ncbi:serine hydrolase [Primorskyibacter sp. 2E233]|uniref:serine hydrolase n=1 Tax=Primorskyibacter sp. 2E233 TaxID=3413431 RepID=UPI003BF39DF0
MFRQLKSQAIGAVLGICLSGPVFAQNADEVLRNLILGGAHAQDFAPTFLAQIPIESVQDVIDQVHALIGEPLVVEASDGQFYIETKTHRAAGKLILDENQKISTLWFDAPEPIPQDMETALMQFNDLADKVSWLVLRDGQVLSERAANTPMAVASAFKLGVLSVLAQDVKMGVRNWNDVVQLEARHKSLPTGELQNLPDGSPVTLHTAAALMISISDNTATDLLIDVLGRDRVSAALGLETLLTTREFFALKLDEAAQADWLAADTPEAKAEIAAKAAQNLPASSVVPPYVPGLEWEVPVSHLCALIGPLADLPLMEMGPGLAEPDNWARVAYKGGSEPGVINFTTALLDDVGREVCVSVTLNNNGSIDMLAAGSAYRGVLAVLR